MKALKNKGFEDSFLKEYGSMIFTRKNIDRFSAGDPALWDEIQNYCDEWTYFESGYDEDTLVVGVNENEE